MTLDNLVIEFGTDEGSFNISRVMASTSFLAIA